MKVVITGGAGFIASQIVDAYVSLGINCIVIDNFSSGKKEFVNRKVKVYDTDIRDKKEIMRIFKLEKPDILNHHAAQVSVRNSVENPLSDANINLLGLLNILEAAQKNNLKKVIFASSGGAVYGDSEIIPTPENYTPLKPLSPYGVAKLAAELYLYFYYMNDHLPYISFRYSNVYGPRQNPHGEAGVVAIFTRKMLSRLSPVINGTGLQTRDYIFVGDVVKVNVIALEKNVVGEFNIGTSKETSVLEIFNKLMQVTNVDLKAIFGPAKRGEQKRSALNITKAKKVLNWEPKVDLDKGLSLTAKYFRNHD